jgi:hypothetical protein
LWSIASTGDTPRSKVSQLFVQPFVAYTKGTWTLTAMSEMTFNWEASGGKATIPLELLGSQADEDRIPSAWRAGRRRVVRRFTGWSP